MTAAELRAILDEARNLKRYDDSDPMMMWDTLFAHRDAFVALVAAVERMDASVSQWHNIKCFCVDCELRKALAAVHAVGKEASGG